MLLLRLTVRKESTCFHMEKKFVIVGKLPLNSIT
ncbi:hypothetical protein Goklo_023839 [Gossypium klotzschianum]|uniref:Uncharacterized protein n=1 Tax=Gossypium klotzschianum TaxID=34286 RepID=A0A7J8W8Q7_9ROSI|nr:hypothetical protein [Gossypium klotzschianum]